MDHVPGNSHADPFTVGLGVVVHYEGIAEGFLLVKDDVALVERHLLERAGVRLIPTKDGVLADPGPFDGLIRRLRPGNPNCQGVRLVPLQSTADVGKPILAVEGVQFPRAAPDVVMQGNPSARLPRVPAGFPKGKDFSQRLPMEQVVAASQIGLVADLVHAHVDHVPFLPVAEDAGAVHRIPVLTLDHDPELERRLHLLEDPLHRLARDQPGGGPCRNHIGSIVGCLGW